MRPPASTSIVVTCARVTTFRWPVACARGIVVTAVEFLASTWQPPRLQKPWYMHAERFWYDRELTEAGPGNGCHPSDRAAPAILSRNSLPRSGGIGYARLRGPSNLLPRGSILPSMLPAWPDTPTSYSTLS